jgi:glycosyltransferase involved in cell wall biosynthesis
VKRERPESKATGYQPLEEVIPMPSVVEGKNSSEREIGLLRDELSRTRDLVLVLQEQIAASEEQLKAAKFESLNAKKIFPKLQSAIEGGLADVEKALRDSFYFQIGRYLAKALKKPWKLPMLPIAIHKAAKRAKAIQEKDKIQSLEEIREHVLAYVHDIIHLTAFLSLEQIATSNDRGLLRRSFWGAFRAKDLRRCYEIIKRLEVLYEADPSEKEEGYISKFRAKLPDDISLFNLVRSAKPEPIEPVGKRICYFLHNSLPISSGGYATRAHGLSTSLHNAGFEIIAITRPGFPLDNIKGLKPKDVSIEEQVNHIVYKRILDPTRKGMKVVDYMTQAADAVEKVLRELRPSIVIAASNYYTGVPALIAARRLGIPFIYEVRGFWEITRISREPEFIHHISYATQEFMEAELCRQADAAFTLTHSMKGELARRGVPIEHVHIVPNAVNPDNFKPKGRSGKLAEKLGIPSHVPVIGYIGSFVQYEGLEELAAACGLLKERGLEFRLLIVGNEDVSGDSLGPISSAILKNAEEAHFADWLIMPGRVPHAEVPDYYSLVDIAPFPRKPQPVTEMVSPMKPLEAMGMEKAVLVSSVQAMSEMVVDGSTGLVFEKGNIVDMADKIQRMVETPDLRKTLGKTARNWVAERRTWQRTAEIAGKVIEDIISNCRLEQH